MSTDWCPRGVAGGGHQADALGNVLVTIDEPKARCGYRCPLWDGVLRPLGFAVLRRLHEYRSVEELLLTAMVEMQVREDHSGDVIHLQADRPERLPKPHDLRGIPAVNDLVALSDAGVDEDRAVGMAYDPGMHGKRPESAVLGMPVRHARHPGQCQALDGGQR